MSSFVAMSVLFGVLVLALLTYFAFMWTKDKGRSDQVSDDTARIPPGKQGGTPSTSETRPRRDGSEGV